MPRRNSGFTLIELMMAVLIMGIVLAIAVPSVRAYMNNARLINAGNDLVADMALARAEAVRTGYVATVCRSSNQTACETSGNDWAVGRIVFSDLDSDGVLDTGENILRKVSALNSAVTMTASAASLFRVSFTPSGGRTRGSSDVTFTVCASGQKQRQITVSASGRTQAKRGTSTCS